MVRCRFSQQTRFGVKDIKFQIVDGGGVDQFHTFYCMYPDKFGLQIYSYVLVGEARTLYHDNMKADLNRLIPFALDNGTHLTKD